MAKVRSYRSCFVPLCTNTTKRTPEKMFLIVPRDEKRRNKWFQAVCRDNPNTKTIFFCCEDHFDLPNDMENYMEYHLMGSISKIRMKPECIPTKFQCQADRRKQTSSGTKRPYILKKQSKPLTKERKKDLQERSTKQVEVESRETSSGSLAIKFDVKMTDQQIKQNKERLYLDKEGEAAYIDTSPLPQHQIDGIRFLYRQFKQEKPGVILNNPEGYGKRLQVALFLEAIRKLLGNPVLILCEDDSTVENWKLTLKKWTSYTEGDIAVESNNIYVKKTIFLKKGTYVAPPYTRREWGVLVVSNDFVPRELIKTQIKVSYKIWLTTVDMRKDLRMLNSIYGWLYSEKVFDVDKFIDSIPPSIGSVNRAKLLNAFLEDVVIIRNSFKILKKIEGQDQDEPTDMPKATRKNKDATGKKIKRSKKTVDVEASTSNSTNVQSTSKATATVTSATIDTTAVPDSGNDVDNDNGKMDVESFIRDRKPIEFKEYDAINDANSSDNSEDMSFAEAVKDIVNNENDVKASCDDHNEEKFSNLNINVNDETKSNSDEESGNEDRKPKPIVTNLTVTCTNELKCAASSSKTSPVIYVSSDEDNVADNYKSNTRADKLARKSADKRKLPGNSSTTTKRDIEDIVSDMEEKALKKFKGSMVDSFF